MRRVLLASVAVGASVLFAPTAHAGNPDVFRGDCFYDVTDRPPAPDDDVYTGVIGDRSTTMTGDSPPTPIGATVTCWIEINGVVAPGTTHSYGDVAGIVGVQAGADPASVTADVGDSWELCHRVDFADATTQSECEAPITIQVPPECGGCSVIGIVLDAWETYLDPVVCSELAQRAGSYPGGVTIDPTGDVTVPDPLSLGLDPIYDCPPYVAPGGNSS